MSFTSKLNNIYFHRYIYIYSTIYQHSIYHHENNKLNSTLISKYSPILIQYYIKTLSPITINLIHFPQIAKILIISLQHLPPENLMQKTAAATTTSTSQLPPPSAAASDASHHPITPPPPPHPLLSPPPSLLSPLSQIRDPNLQTFI